MFKYWSLLLSHESWSKSCERRSSGLNVAFITNPAWGAGRLSLLTKVLVIFLFFSHFLIQSFLFFLFSQSWVPYFPIFLSIHGTGFLRLRNSAWDFWGVNFWSRDFLGSFVGSPRDFFGFWFLPPFDHPHHLKSRVSPALGGGRAYSQEALVWYFIFYMHCLWGGHLLGGDRLLEHEFILGNTVIA